MAKGICSKSGPHNPDCPACKATVYDLFPNWDEMHAKALAAWLHTCERCSFEYYKTVDSCPKCNKVR